MIHHKKKDTEDARYRLLSMSLVLILYASCAFLRPGLQGREGDGSVINVSPSQDLQSVLDSASP